MKIFQKLKVITKILSPKGMRSILLYLYNIADVNSYGRTNEIVNIIEQNNYKSFVEVGVWRGTNIISIAKRFNSVMCYGYDSYDSLEYSNQSFYKDDKAQILIKEADIVFNHVKSESLKLKNFFLYRKSSEQGANDFEDESIDMVFIDANHSFLSVKNDINNWLPKVKKGGCLSGHDYSLKFYGVVQAVNLILGADSIIVKSDDTWFHFKK